MPRGLYRQSRRLIKLFWVAALSPLALLAFYAFTPTAALMALAEPINNFFWTHIKPVSVENCGAKCSLVAFSLIAIPLSWGASVVLAVVAIPLTVQYRSAQLEALRRGLAPLGKMPDGAVKPLPKSETAALVGIVSMALFSAMLLAVVYGLYNFGGSDRTTHPRTGQGYSLGHVSVLIAILMSVAQFGSTMLMSIVTIVALSLKSILKI